MKHDRTEIVFLVLPCCRYTTNEKLLLNFLNSNELPFTGSIVYLFNVSNVAFCIAGFIEFGSAAITSVPFVLPAVLSASRAV